MLFPLLPRWLETLVCAVVRCIMLLLLCALIFRVPD
jgi:hypothetical protein